VGAILELSDHRENVLDPALLNPIRRTISSEELVWGEQPQAGFLRRVQIAKFPDQPLQPEQIVAAVRLRLGPACSPPRHGLRCGVEKLGDLPGCDSALLLNLIETRG